jgi:hypothetical protein
VDADGSTITSGRHDATSGHGAVAVGAWIDDPDRDRDRDDARDLSARVDLRLPAGLDPELLRKASVQVSLFDERMAEVARVKVSLPQPGRHGRPTNRETVPLALINNALTPARWTPVVATHCLPL